MWPLGRFAYEGRCGHRPFTGAPPVDIAAAHVNDPVPPLPDSVDLQLNQFVMSMLSKDPLDRPADALVVARTLSRIERRLLDQQTALNDATIVVPSGKRIPRVVSSAPHMSDAAKPGLPGHPRQSPSAENNPQPHPPADRPAGNAVWKEQK